MKKHKITFNSDSNRRVFSYEEATKLGLIGMSEDCKKELERMETAHIRGLIHLRKNPILLD